MVDPRGLVTPFEGGPSLDWSIGADDRWHEPRREAAVRQRLVHDSPVVETAMRVPGGDAIHRAYAIHSTNAGPCVIVEIENQTGIAFAVGLTVRADRDAEASVGLEETEITVDGVPTVLLPKPPPPGGDAPHEVTAMFPLAHTATLRVALPLRGTDRSVFPDAVPSAEQVAQGWRAQTRRGLQIEVPDARLQAAVDASRRHLLVFHGGEDLVWWPTQEFDFVEAVALVGALDGYGFHDEAEQVLATWPERQATDGLFVGLPGRVPATGAALVALGNHWRATRDAGLVDALLESMVKGAGWLAKHGSDDPAWARRGLDAVAAMLAGVGQPGGADDVADHARGFPPVAATERGATNIWSSVQALLAEASPTITWAASGRGDDGATTARFLNDVRDLLVKEVSGDTGLALCPLVPESWLGQAVEVHDAPTALGRCSFAVRWHGKRPALLWELTPHPGVGTITITAPGLDPSWSSTHASGEALLA